MVRLASVVSGVMGLATLAAPAVAQFDGEVTATVSTSTTDGDRLELASLTTDVVDGSVVGMLQPTDPSSGVPTGMFEFSISAIDSITRDVSFTFLFDDNVVPSGTTVMGELPTFVRFDLFTDADPLVAQDGAVLEVLSSSFAFSTVDDGFEPPFPFDIAVFEFQGELSLNLAQGFSNGEIPAEDLNINGFTGSFIYTVVPAPGAAAMFGLAAAGACGRRRKAVMS